MGTSNLLVTMTYSIVEFKVRVFVESLRELSSKRRILVIMVLLNFIKQHHYKMNMLDNDVGNG